MKRTPLALLFSLTVALAACGGGSSGGPPPTPAPTATPTPVTSSCIVTNKSTGFGWGPPEIQLQLGFPFASGSGAGQTVAVVIDSNINPADVQTYLAHYGITQTGTITDEPVDGATGQCLETSSAPEQDEATLDVETIAGLAPGANIIIYQIPNLAGANANDDQYLADAYNKIISDGKAFVVNTSLGGCENSSIAQTPENPVMLTGAGKGILFASAGGDDGNLCNAGTSSSSGDQVGPSYPASDPSGAGVGGTETNKPNLLTNPVEWNDQSCQSPRHICAGGGGISNLFTIPSYQNNNTLLSNCLSPSAGSPCSAIKRNTPDVSMPGEDDSVYEGGWILVDGTSWASPEYASLIADLYQYCNATAGIKNPQTIPYYVQSAAASDFIDVTSGTDELASPDNRTPFYVAGPGYDDSNGIGVPKGAAFAQTACPNHVPAAGLVTTGMTTMMSAMRSVAGSTIDATPRVAGLIDRGERPASDTERVQFVLNDEPGVAANEAQLVQALQASGFTIEQRFDNHLIVDAHATTATVERFFKTQVHNVDQGSLGTRYMPVMPLTLPSSVAPFIATVNLDSVVTRHRMLHIVH